MNLSGEIQTQLQTATKQVWASNKGVQAPADYPSSSWPLGLFYSTIALKSALYSR